MNIQEMPFERLVELHHPLILHVLRSVHIYREHDIYYQVGLIGLWEAQTRFNTEKGSFSTFAFSTIRGKVLASLSKENQFHDRNLTTQYDSQLDVIDESAEVEIEEDILTTYCEGLSENQLKWVKGKFIEDKKNKDIALEHGVTEQAVKSWGREAMKKLRQNIEEMDSSIT